MKKFLFLVSLFIMSSALGSGSSGGVGLRPVIPEAIMIDENTVGISEKTMHDIMKASLKSEANSPIIELTIGEDKLNLSPSAFDFESRIITTTNSVNGQQVMLRPVKFDVNIFRNIP